MPIPRTLFIRNGFNDTLVDCEVFIDDNIIEDISIAVDINQFYNYICRFEVPGQLANSFTRELDRLQELRGEWFEVQIDQGWNSIYDFAKARLQEAIERFSSDATKETDLGYVED